MADTSNLSLLSSVIAITYGPLELGVDHTHVCTYCKVLLDYQELQIWSRCETIMLFSMKLTHRESVRTEHILSPPQLMMMMMINIMIMIMTMMV